MRKIGSTQEPTVAQKFLERDVAMAANPEILRTKHDVFLGDAREMSQLDPAIRPIHLVVTSPPYWTLKSYEDSSGAAQLGSMRDYTQFQEELAKVWRRCYEILVPGGRMCIVVGDVCLPRRVDGRHRVIPLHADIALHCGRLGFDYLTPILWHKIANAVTEVEGNGSPFLGKPYEPNAVIKNDFEYVMLFRKPGGYRNPTFEQRRLSLIDKADHAKWFRSIWTDISGANSRKGHPAPFPTKLAYRLIRMFSFVGDIVLDPFVGSGSTTEAAIQAYRSSIGYEIEPVYYTGMKQRFGQLEDGVEVRFS